MNFKTISMLSVVALSSSVYAGANVTCHLTSIHNKTISATLPLTAVHKDGAESNGQGLTIGKENHSFIMELSTEGAFFRVDVMFFENNHVQDEVGNLTCKFKKTAGNSVICQEPIYSQSGKLIAHFSCINN